MERISSDDQADRPSVDDLFRDNAPALIAWAAVRIPAGLRSYVAPEDVAQEVWLRAVRSYADTFDPSRATPRVWIFAVAKNVLFEAQRSAAKVQREGRADGETARYHNLAEIPDSVTSFTARIARNENLLRFVERVAELEESDRSLLLQCGIEGLPVHAVAPRLGIEVEAAKKRWQRLRARVVDWPAAADVVAT